MKKIVIIAVMFTATIGRSQQVDDMISVQTGYTNQVYYSFENGEISNINNNDWEIAFDVSAFGSSIRTNGQAGIELYTTPFDTTNWMSIDTAGLSNWTLNLDSDKSWSQGAFNADYDMNNDLDLGWGLYSTITHHIIGNKTFILKYSDGSVKKIWIKLLASGEYKFSYSDLDNTNATETTIQKSTYSGKNFVYYSLSNDLLIDREPASDDWDILFTKYVTEYAPGFPYAVTGVLLNNGAEAYLDETVETNTAIFNSSAVFESDINTIGYNWKTFDMGSFTYVLDDSATYFIKTVEGDIWSMGFTGFDGSGTGNIEFTVEQIESANLDNNHFTSITTFPNPVSNELHINSSKKGEASVSLYNINGQEVDRQFFEFNGTSLIYNVAKYNEGIYILTIQFENGAAINEKIIIKK
jgi:hypothetical protein